MSPWIRSLLIWLVVAALPVQAWAAAATVNCGPSHHRIAEAFVLADHDARSAIHHHGETSADERVSDRPHANSMPCVNPDGNASPDQGQLNKLSKFKCTACASCCTPVALPAHTILFEAMRLADSIASPIYRTVPVFLTDWPERPPRTFLF